MATPGGNGRGGLDAVGPFMTFVPFMFFLFRLLGKPAIDRDHDNARSE
jgi:hypothetical protein